MKGCIMKRTIGIVAAFAILSACATLPSPEVMKAETASYQLPKLPEQEKALIYVVRPSGAAGLISFAVYLGDQELQSEMGYTRSIQHVHFNVAPGEHRVYSHAENWADVQVSAKPGEVIFIKQEPIFGILFARNNLSVIDELEGKFHVKNTTRGTIIKQDK